MPTNEQWAEYATKVFGPGEEIPAERLVPIGQYKWTDDYTHLRNLTCRNHTTARYSTKNPWTRSLHLLRIPNGNIERSPQGECTCPFGDLAVIMEEANG